jgi:hypothetical protein
MCYAVFIGTNQKQPPEPPFVQGETMLFLTEESETEHEKQFEKVGLLEKFSKKYVYHAGSWQGCSCGFSFASVIGGLDDEDMTKNGQSTRKLLKLIEKLGKTEGNIELYCCWEGDWVLPIVEKIAFNFSRIKQYSDDFAFEERVFIDFKK